MNKVNFSVLSANYRKLETCIKEVDAFGVDGFHLDVMDGHFVPNMSFGVDMIKLFRSLTEKHCDCHLMISNVEDYIHEYAKTGVDSLSFHYEATFKRLEMLQIIRSYGIKAGIVLRPETRARVLLPLLKEFDFVLQMTVNPGFGGQAFMEECLENVNELALMKKQYNVAFDIQVDGGINKDTAKKCALLGANVFVMGNAISSSNDPKKLIKEVQNI